MKFRSVPAAVHGALGGALLLAVVHFLSAALATQNELVPPTSGIFTGVQFSQKIGDAFRSIASGNKGAIAPANVGGSAVDGLEWIDDSVTPWVKKRFVNGDWAVEGYLDPTTSSFSAVVGGGLGSIASGTTTDLGSVAQANISITGTTTITGFGASAKDGVTKFIRFVDAVKLTNSVSLAIPGGFDLTTAAGDRAVVTHLGSGNWEVTTYTRASGIPLDISAVGRYSLNTTESVAGLHVPAMGQALTRTSYPAYLAKVTRGQNGTRTSGNATITSVANTDGFGAGMPVEGTGIADNCTIASLVANTSITLNSSACVTSGSATVGTITVFLTGYGRTGDKTTVGVPECRTRMLAGRDRNDPGSFAGFLTSGVFGANPQIFNVAGNSAESFTMALANLIQHTHANSLTDPGHAHNNPLPLQGSLAGGSPVSAALQGNNASGGTTLNFSDSAGQTTGITITNAAAGSASPTPMRTVPPMITAACDIRVIP